MPGSLEELEEAFKVILLVVAVIMICLVCCLLALLPEHPYAVFNLFNLLIGQGDPGDSRPASLNPFKGLVVGVDERAYHLLLRAEATTA